jgi:hypothetical protein
MVPPLQQMMILPRIPVRMDPHDDPQRIHLWFLMASTLRVSPFVCIIIIDLHNILFFSKLSPCSTGHHTNLFYSQQTIHIAQLRSIVEAILPRNGATIVKQSRRALQGDKEDRYGIIGSDGTHKRTLFVDRKNGKVYEEMDDDDDDGSAYEGRFSNTIKLGLVSSCCICYRWNAN